MAKKPWGGAGAWAAESELAESQLEQEEQHHHHQQQQQHQASLFAGDAAFPSLGEAVHAKVTKKKKQQPVSLAKFIAGGTPAFSESKGLTTEEKMALPTGPRERSAEEVALGGLGGGFKDYGGYRGEGRDRDYGRDREGGFGGRRSERESGFGRGFAGDRDGPDDGPSRADTTDDWGASKKLAPPSRGRYEDDGRRGGRFDDRDFPSKADDDSHWGSSKKFVPAPPSNGATRRVSKYDFSSSRIGAPLDSSSKADEADSWAAAKKSAPIGGYDSSSQRDRDFWNSREKDGVGGDSWTRKEVERTSERPRLVLQPRTQPLDSAPPPSIKEDTENEPPPSEVSTELPSKPHKANPFGEAKPREVILEEKGLSWKKIDAELGQKPSDRVDSEELALKEEIKAIEDAIKLAEAKSSEEEVEGDARETLTDLKEQLTKKEGELEQLRAAFRDKISGFRGGGERFGGNRNSARDSDVWSKHGSNGRSIAEGKGRW